MIKASLVVQSRELTLADISKAMGRLPDDGYDRGSLAPVRRFPRQWTSWSAELAWSHDVHGGTEGLATAIEGLGQQLAERAAMLTLRGCDVVISVHQELTDTPESLGMHLTSGAIRWLATAGAALDIDQYLDLGSD